MRIRIVDNFDSFTYNLVQAFGELGAEVSVQRARGTSVAELWAARPNGVVISAGPGRPERAGVWIDAVRELAEEGVPVLGVCLGHQAIGVAYGARIVRSPRPVHGKTSPIQHEGHGLLRGLPSPFEATRYHSLVVDAERLPAALRVTATSPEGEIMGLCHRTLPVEGVQFHPESLLTRAGPDLLANFLERCREHRS